ncbi:MAG TPA: DsbA family oxidoreductase [Ramlibacter sp.]|uniref:DsbA family oxidoreductase n=1 Tax=Ramlibacter sp. TaxID=1917967 RepID=UPI002C4EF9E2|nr:DsbA family oxidoreductase [Ramlibacter sp.]HVZ45521.1 DsbA family oxidoreductase [Ramlibacter sp.]
MNKPLKLSFVSDVACPWCAIGLASLGKALENLDGEVAAQLHFEPFELNPQMGPEGEDVTEHLTKKYGSTPEQQAASREAIRQRGAAVGFAFRKEGRGRVWNTFDAHRLLYWAGEQDEAKQHALKRELLKAYHGEARNPSERDVLLDCAAKAGLDRAQAAAVLDEKRYTEEVRERERHWQEHGIHAVPSVVVDDQYLIQGGQPPEVFEEALREIARKRNA